MKENVCEKLKLLRIENQMSQNDVAEYLNISRQAISRWELGRAYPDLDNIVLLCKLYNISIEELIGTQQNEEVVVEERAKESTADTKASNIEMIGLAVIIVLSSHFAFAGVVINLAVVVWMACNRKKYIFIYLLCLLCLSINAYNIYIFVSHMMPDPGTAHIQIIT